MIDAQEVCAVLRGMIASRGEVFVDQQNDPTVILHHGGWKIYIFDDAGQPDYVEYARAPDGREVAIDHWSMEQEPIANLSDHEVELLEGFMPEHWSASNDALDKWYGISR